jgi:ankyrin repeat protein
LFFASNVEVVQLLVNAGTNVNVKNNAGENAFVYQMLYNRPEVVSFLVKNGVDIRVKNKYGESALIQAISHEKNNVEPDFKITRELLNLGEDVNAKNLRGETPIAIVAGDDTYGGEGKRLEIVKLLLEKGAIINARTNEGVTALMAAAIHGNTNTVKFLLDNGANPNIADRDEFTPLMAACWHMGNIDTVRLLLKNGADANVKDVTGKSAIDYAKKFERKDILDLLISSRSVN